MMLAIKAQPELFTTRELEEIERRWSEGIPSQEVISLFQARGVKLSEATFRKYVQLGLLPTSRRVGRKGKHRGSRGLYPASVVRRINVIKRMMAEDLTLEEIRDSFFSVQNQLEKAGEASGKVINYMGAGLPVVCFEGKNNRRFLGDGGIYASDDKVENLVEKIIWAVDNPEKARNLGEKNKKRVEEVFSWNNSIRDTVEAFAMLTSRNK